MKSVIIALSLALTFNVIAEDQAHERPNWETRHSGIAGQVFIAFTGPPVEPPPPAPYQAKIAVYSQTGRFMTEIQTDTQGSFALKLKPGTYRVVPLIPDQPRLPGGGDGPPPPIPIGWPQDVVVRFKQFTPVTIVYVQRTQ